MKKLLLLIIIILCCSKANAQEKNDSLVSITKKNWVGAQISDLGVYFNNNPGSFEIVEDGLAIKNPQKQDYPWFLQVPVLGRIPLEEGHDYVLRLTLKVPSDGTYWLDMCSWEVGYTCSCQVPVIASDDFQIIDVEYPEYGRSVTDGMVMLGCGGVVGTTILKEIEVLEKRNTTDIQSIKVANSPNNDVFNLSGQKVNTTYKGIVIRNGKRVVVK